MQNSDYEYLLDSLADYYNLNTEEIAQLKSNGGLSIDEVYFFITYDEESDPDKLSVYCVFGKPPADKEIFVLRRLLEENTLLFGGKGPTFMINSADGNVLLAEHHRLSQVSADTLAEMLNNWVSGAKEWQQTYYLDASDLGADTAFHGLLPDFA